MLRLWELASQRAAQAIAAIAGPTVLSMKGSAHWFTARKLDLCAKNGLHQSSVDQRRPLSFAFAFCRLHCPCCNFDRSSFFPAVLSDSWPEQTQLPGNWAPRRRTTTVAVSCRDHPLLSSVAQRGPSGQPQFSLFGNLDALSSSLVTEIMR